MILLCFVVLSCDWENGVFVNLRNVRLEYIVSGTVSNATITYTNCSSNNVTINDAHLPWSRVIYVSNGFYASLRATSAEPTGGLTVEMFANGEPIRGSSGTRSVFIFTWIRVD